MTVRLIDESVTTISCERNVDSPNHRFCTPCRGRRPRSISTLGVEVNLLEFRDAPQAQTNSRRHFSAGNFSISS